MDYIHVDLMGAQMEECMGDSMERDYAAFIDYIIEEWEVILIFFL